MPASSRPAPGADERTILAAFLLGHMAYAMSRGVPREALLELARRHGEDPKRWSERDVRVPLELAKQMWELVADYLPDEPLGLDMIEHVDLTHRLGAVAYAASHAADVNAAFDIYIRFQSVIRLNPQTRLSREDTAEGCSVVVDYDYDFSPAMPRIVEAVAAMALRFARSLADAELPPPLAVEFAHPPAGPRSRYDEYFGVPVRFEAPRNIVAVSRELLNTPLRSAEPGLFHYLTQHLEMVLEQLQPAASDPLADVRTAIAEHAAKADYQADAIAKALATSLRSLQRRVQGEGTSLRALIDEARLANARELLRNSRLSTDEVAFLLGYSDLRGFTRAFKRWTGQTPARFRRERS